MRVQDWARLLGLAGIWSLQYILLRLAVPVFGVIASMITLGETFDVFTLAALLLIVGGIAIGTGPGRSVGGKTEGASSRPR